MILGQAAWNIENCTFEEVSETSDLEWDIESASERYLRPINGARIAVVRGREFEDVDRKVLLDLSMSLDKLSASDKEPVLVPGVVLGLKTAEGGLAKLRVVGFRDLQDFSFPEAALLEVP